MNAESSQVKIAPFRAVRNAYAGPQQLALAGGIRRALISPDSVVTLSGPVGTGKTASVRHALSRISHSVVVARIGRVHLHRDDVLEVLLDEFGVSQKPVSALQRFSAVKRLLSNWAEVGTDVFVVVEDGERLGVEALTELESLTAADDDTPGAHLILMGTEALGQFLRHPALARLKQRVRRNLAFEPFSLEETRGYLSHCLSVAGKDLADVFADDAIDILHRLSGGVARVINNVAETMMIVAADTGSGKITGALARNIAVEDFDFETTEPVRTPAESGRISRPADDPAGENLSQTASDDLRDGGAPGASASADVRGASTAATGTRTSAAEDDSDIPALIQDTLPPMPALTDTDIEAANQAVERAPGAAAGEAHQLLDELIASRPTDTVTPPATDSGAGKLRLEPRIPEPLSKSTDTADTQTMKALDSALRPDTQLLRTLEEPVEPVVDDAPVPLGLRKEITDDRSRSPQAETTSVPTLAASADPEDDDLPTLSNSMRFDVPEDASADAEMPPAESDIRAGDNTVNDADAAVPGTACDQGAAANSAECAGVVKEPGPLPAVTPGGTASTDSRETPRSPAADTSSSGASTLSAQPAQAAAEPVAELRIDPDPDLGSGPLADDSGPATKAGGESEAHAVTNRFPPELALDDPARADDDVEIEASAEVQRPEIGTAGAIAADRALSKTGGDRPAVADPTTDAADAAQESTPEADAAEPARKADFLRLEETPDNELPEISLVPEITLDKSLDDHQKAAQARLLKEAERRAETSASAESRESSAEETEAKSDSAAEQTGKDADDDEAERRQRLESLAARFGSARSIEDVLDDTAAETLFGEEFSQIAAAVTAMHESTSSESETPDRGGDEAEPPVTLSLEESGEAGPGATASSMPVTDDDATAREPVSTAVPPGPAGGNGAGSSAAPTTAKNTPAQAAAKAPGAALGSPGAPPRPPSPADGTKLDSSAAQRLEMVRALNKKAGKAMPPMPDSAGEEIVLGGDDNSPTSSGPRPEPIENQFGLSMTATLKALSAENIKSMQDEEEAEKKEKKKGLLSRFRRS